MNIKKAFAGIWALSGCLLLLSMNACHSSRIIQHPVIDSAVALPDAPPDSTGIEITDSVLYAREVYQKLRAHKNDFETFSARIKSVLQTDDKKEEANIVLRIKKDSAIWVSVSALLGIEVVRAIITPDSLKVLNRLNKEYIARSKEFMQEFTHLPLDFYAIQDLLLGNPIWADSSYPSGYSRDTAVTVLQLQQRGLRHYMTISEDYFLLLRSLIREEDPLQQRVITIGYGDYSRQQGKFFPSSRVLMVQDKSPVTLQLDFKSYTFNEMLSFPFNVPKNYSRN